MQLQEHHKIKDAINVHNGQLEDRKCAEMFCGAGDMKTTIQ